MDKKNILICYHSSQFGGVEKQILDIITGLSSKFNIFVVCPDGPLVKEYLNAGAIKHYDLKPKFEADFWYSYKISKIVKENNIDVVHSHELLTGCLATFGAWLGGSPKRIYHVHTPFSMWEHNSLKSYPALIINTIVNFIVGNFFATDVLALTESIKEIRVTREFIFPSKVRIIPNGIDLSEIYFSENERNEFRSRYGISSETFVIGHMARFTEEKRQDWIIKAFSSFAKDKDVKLVLAGGGKLLRNCKELAEQLNVKGKIIFTDRFDEKDKRAILSSFDLFVFPSSAEGFGIVLAEAMSVGLNCLASDLPVLKDVGEDSISYFETNSLDSLQEKLADIITKPRCKNENAKNLVKKYDIKTFWHNYETLYRGS